MYNEADKPKCGRNEMKAYEFVMEKIYVTRLEKTTKYFRFFISHEI